MSQLSMSNVTRWSAQLINIREEITGTGKLGTSSNNSSAFSKQEQYAVIRATVNPALRGKIDMMLRRRLQPSLEVSSDKLQWSTEDLAAFWPRARDVTPLDIVSNRDEEAYRESMNPSVCDLATRALDEIDKKSGYVYLYEVDDNPRLVKIGYTLRCFS
ncbi:hypothetical protein Q7P37_003068 [Cladosporium fusiforme]